MKTLQYLIFIAAIAFAAVAVLMNCAALNASDQAAIGADAVSISVCQAAAKDCKDGDAGARKCWAVYDDCMARHGLKDAGAQ